MSTKYTPGIYTRAELAARIRQFKVDPAYQPIVDALHEKIQEEAERDYEKTFNPNHTQAEILLKEITEWRKEEAESKYDYNGTKTSIKDLIKRLEEHTKLETDRLNSNRPDTGIKPR